MKLTIEPRKGESKSEIKQIRRGGNIPAVIYAQGKASAMILVNGVEFATILRKMKDGHLPTTVFTLTEGKHTKKAIIKDIQYGLTSYKVSHIDFEELVEGAKVNVKVPVRCTGAADCAGIKLGGFLRQVAPFVKVECEPKSIPTEFVVDVKDLGIRQSKRLKDIPMPKGVKPLDSLNQVVAIVAKQRG